VPKQEKVIRRPALAKAIWDILEGFGEVHNREGTGKAYKVIRIILASITDALRRGETIKITGLGTFSTYTRLPRYRSISYYEPGTKKVIARATVLTKPRQIVKFTPSKGIVKELNKETKDE
jgi:nucleoid DNA-binding protein